jgi:hypothetical protein
MVDARDKLASMAKTVDARQKLEKIRNLKQGKVSWKEQMLFRWWTRKE